MYRFGFNRKMGGNKMRRRRFMAPAVVAMLFVNTIIQNAPAEQTIETEAQEKEVKVNSQTTPAA